MFKPSLFLKKRLYKYCDSCGKRMQNITKLVKQKHQYDSIYYCKKCAIMYGFSVMHTKGKIILEVKAWENTHN